MGRLARWLAVAATILFTLPLSSCSRSIFRVMITDFDSMEVLGIRMWKQGPNTGTFEESLEVSFSDPRIDEDGEWLSYRQLVDGEVVAGAIWTAITRDPDNPDRVTMRLLLTALEHGDHWLSSYNAHGDSALSENPFCL
jgi:hypothetical protein